MAGEPLKAVIDGKLVLMDDAAIAALAENGMSLATGRTQHEKESDMGYAEEQLEEIRRRKEADMEKTVFTSADLNVIKEAIDRKDQERIDFIRENYGDQLADGMTKLFREPISNFSYRIRRSVDNEMIARDAAA